MHRVAVFSLGPILALATPAIIQAANIVIDRGDLVVAEGVVQRRDPSGSPVYSQDNVYSSFDSFSGLTPDSNMISTSASGSYQDTATGTQLVASAQGSASVTSALAYDGFGQLTSYSVAGQYADSVTTGTLAGYEPAGTPVDSIAAYQATPVYNSGMSLIVNTPTDFEIAVGQSGSSGTVFNAAEIYLDANNDHSFNPADGDAIVVDFFVVDSNASDSRTGTLAPSAAPYRIFFFGNVYDDITTDNTSISSSSDFTGTFTVVPEPGAGSALLLAAGMMARRQRRAQRRID